MALAKIGRGIGRVISFFTGKPTSATSVAGEIAHIAARETGKINPETAEAIAEAVVGKIDQKRRARRKAGAAKAAAAKGASKP